MKRLHLYDGTVAWAKQIIGSGYENTLSVNSDGTEISVADVHR